MADRGSEGSQGRGNPRFGFGLTPEEFGDDRSMFIR